MREIIIRRLGEADLTLLLSVKDGVFDHPLRSDQARAFLEDALHEIVVATDGAEIIGMASGTILFHPDKPPAFFIAEVGTHEDYQRRGIATRMVETLMQIARDRGCEGIWLATEADNEPARSLYRQLGARETAGIVVYDWDGAMDDPEGAVQNA